MTERAVQSNNLNEETDFNANLLYSVIADKIDSLDFNMIKHEVQRFVEDQGQLDIWTKEYFLQLAKSIKYKR